MQLIDQMSQQIEQQRSSRSEQTQLKYLSQSIWLEESINPIIVQRFLIVAAAAIIAFIIWAGFTPVNEIAHTDGEVVPEGFAQVIQHLEGGMVKEILVAEGDMIDEGQVIAKLDDNKLLGQLNEAKIKLESMQKESADYNSLLHAQSKHDASSQSTQELNNTSGTATSMIDSQRKQRDVIEDQLKQKRLEIKRLSAKVDRLNKGLDLANSALRIQENIFAKGYGSRIALLKYQQDASSVEGQKNEAIEELNNAKSAVSEYENRLASLGANQTDDAVQMLAKLGFEISRQQEIVDSLQVQLGRLDIRSPVRGIVKSLAINTIGGVVMPGRTIAEVIPLDRDLVVEAKLNPRDVGHVHIGQTIHVKVTAYEFSRYGSIPGLVEFISAGTALSVNNQPYYRVKIRLKQRHVGRDSHRNLIMPGMMVVGDIITGQKSVLAYLLKPIHVSLQNAMTER